MQIPAPRDTTIRQHLARRALTAIVAAIVSLSLLSGCAMNEQTRLERQTAMAEKREQYAYERQACEQSSRGAWLCTSGSERAREAFPWLYCSCTDNQSALR